MRYGFWLPIFGGWLRNVDDEGMPPSFEYASRVARSAEQWGYDTTLIAELFLNDIKGPREDSLEAWSTASALAAVTNTLEIMTAIRPGFHNPAIAAKMIANLDHISRGRITLNVVSAWWEEEARQYGGIFTDHDARYERTEEFLAVLKGLWTQEIFTYQGKYYQIPDTHLAPKPIQRPYPTLYAGGESPRGKSMIAASCDAYVMHGGTVSEVAIKIADMRSRREALKKPPFSCFGMAAYVVCRDTQNRVEAELDRITQVKETSGYAGYRDFVNKSQLETTVKLQDYSVSNRGLRPNLVGTPEEIADRILAFERVGVNLLLLQFSPQLEEMERFSREVMPLVTAKRGLAVQ